MCSSLESLLVKIKDLQPLQHRAVASLIGATVADAATRPLHWVYNQEKLNNILDGSTTPEFWTTNQSPFYSRALGERSAYNDAMFVGLKHLYDQKVQNSHDSHVVNKNLCDDIVKFFGDGTPYMDAYKRRKVAYDSTNRGAFKGPVEGPWIQAAVLKFMENYAQMEGETSFELGDKTNNEYDGFCLALPWLVLLCAQNNKNIEVPLNVCKLLSTHEETLKTFQLMFLLVSEYISGHTDPVSTVKNEARKLQPELLKAMENVGSTLHESYIDVTKRHGNACGLPGSFLGAYGAMLRCDSFVEAVRLNITAGGCNCSRANLIGACYAAKYGIDSIPIDWLRKTKDIEKIIEMAVTVIA